MTPRRWSFALVLRQLTGAQSTLRRADDSTPGGRMRLVVKLARMRVIGPLIKRALLWWTARIIRRELAKLTPEEAHRAIERALAQIEGP